MATDFEPADTVSGESLHDFLNQALAAEETTRPPDYDAILAILDFAYTRSDGWVAVQVEDNYNREVELAAPVVRAALRGSQAILPALILRQTVRKSTIQKFKTHRG